MRGCPPLPWRTKGLGRDGTRKAPRAGSFLLQPPERKTCFPRDWPFRGRRGEGPCPNQARVPHMGSRQSSEWTRLALSWGRDPALLLWAPSRPPPSSLSTTLPSVNMGSARGAAGTRASCLYCCSGNRTWASWKCTLGSDSLGRPARDVYPGWPGESGSHLGELQD